MSDLLDRLKTALADRYAIERELGAGGMATVYLADDRKLNRKVAIKVLRPDLAAALGPERFLREIETAARLHTTHTYWPSTIPVKPTASSTTSCPSPKGSRYGTD